MTRPAIPGHHTGLKNEARENFGTASRALERKVSTVAGPSVPAAVA